MEPSNLLATQAARSSGQVVRLMSIWSHADPNLWYEVDAGQRIQAVSQGWDTFARANGGAHGVLAADIAGRLLVDAIAGDSLKIAVQAMLTSILNGSRPSIVVPYSCDAPELRRVMTATFTPIGRHADVTGVRVTCTAARQISRIAMAIIGADPAGRAGLPIQSICSCCRRLASPQRSQEWLDAEEYTRRGHSSEVRLSHGLCPECASVIADL